MWLQRFQINRRSGYEITHSHLKLLDLDMEVIRDHLKVLFFNKTGRGSYDFIKNKKGFIYNRTENKKGRPMPTKKVTTARSYNRTDSL
jgi:hypothetical protein